MKKIFKAMIAAILCAAIVIISIGSGEGTAYAAKKIPVKVGFNGKSVTLAKDINKGFDNQILKTLKKKLGKPKKKTDGATFYTWKKGESSVSYSDGEFSYLEVYINDKNGSLFGVKVGMKKDAALKKVKKLTGAKEGKEGIYVYGEANNPKLDEVMVVPIPRCMASKVFLKEGRVTSIYYGSSVYEI